MPPMPRPDLPATEAELSTRADALTGARLADIAAWLRVPVPTDLRRAKGWVGQLVEAALGAQGGSRPAPDFEALGIELKTLPVGSDGRPLESTFVCTAPIEGAFEPSWEASRVRHKLARVLWVPVHGDRGVPPGERTIGRPRLWSPDPAQEAALAADWRLLSELLAGGELHRIDARLGAVMQLRPKGANAADYAWMLDDEGTWVRAVPYGFYLRAGFTAGVVGRLP